MKIIFDLIAGDDQLNGFMHACDVFEAGKHLGDHIQFVADFEQKKEEDIDIPRVIEGMKDAVRKGDQKSNVIFLSVRQIDGVKTNKYPPYIKEGVQSISDGEKWGMFHEMLDRIGYDVEHTQFMQVTEAKLRV